MGEMLRHSPGDGAELTIDLGALVSNYEFLRRSAAPATCAAVVKANAYGLGVDKVAAALANAGCEVFFVATNNEGIELRQILPDAVIYVLNGLISGTEQTFADFNLRPVLNDPAQIDAWSFFARTRPRAPSAAAIHFDTGMNRLGLSVKQTRDLIAAPARIAFDPTLIISHLACADTPEAPMNARQLEIFTGLLRDFNRSRSANPVPGSIANSAGTLAGADFHLDLVRPGLALYGGNPFAGRPNPMRPVIRLKAKILQLRDIAAGDSVGYSSTYRASEPRKIATLDVGYADGYLRSFSGRGQAFIDGIEVAVIGRISMDMLAVDVTDVPPETLMSGVGVDLLGGPATLDAATKVSGLSAYELLTLLGRRYKRRYVGFVEQTTETADTI